MKILRKTSFIFLMSISFLMTNCKKEVENEKTIPPINYQGVKSSNGILIFESDSVFNKILKETLNKSEEDLDLWESKFENFKSYRSIFLQAKRDLSKTETEDEYKKALDKYTDLITVDDNGLKSKYSSELFSRFYNSNGIFQIGTQIISYNELGLSITKDLNNYELQELEKNKFNLKPEIIDKKINLVRTNKNIKTNSTVSYTSIVYGEIYNQLIVDGKRRLFINVYNDYNPSSFSGIIYMVLRQQEKRLFGNWRDNATIYTVADFNWNSIHSTSSPEVPIFRTGSNSGFYTNEMYSFYLYFIPDYFLLYSFNFDGLFYSRGVPNSDRTIINMRNF